MTDTPIEPTDFAAAGDDEELMFGDVPAAPPRKPRRTPAKGRDAAELPPSAAPDTAATEEPADPPAPVPQPGDASAGSDHPAAPRDRRQVMLLAIVCLALFTSLMSLGGLIAVSRTLAAANAQRAQASSERAELARLPAMIAALDRVDARLAAAPAQPVAATAAAGAAPLTAEDLHHGLDDLRLALDKRQPAGASAIGDTLHSGFGEVGARLDRIEAQLAHAGPARSGAPR